MIKFSNNCLVNIETGEIITNELTPRFNNYDYSNWKEDGIRFLEPMTAYECEKDNIPEENFIAEEKLDGHRALLFITPKGNRLFSRRISKKTGWFAENTDSLPHIRDFKISNEFYGTVLDGEITMPTGVFADVQGVTGALPETALQNQIEKGFAIINVFDILYYKGLNVQSFPLWERKKLLKKVVEAIDNPCIKEIISFATPETCRNYPELSLTCVNSFRDLLEKMWEEGKEGLIIKDLNAKYEQKRSKSFLKLKEIQTYDVVIMGYQPPTREFTGKTDLDKWEYWEGNEPVTKPYAKGWIGAIGFGVYKDGKLIKVGEAKGITEEDLEYIKNNSKKLIGTVIEVKAQGILDKETGTLRHPRFSRFRPDYDPYKCTFNKHIGVE